MIQVYNPELVAAVQDFVNDEITEADITEQILTRFGLRRSDANRELIREVIRGCDAGTATAVN